MWMRWAVVMLVGCAAPVAVDRPVEPRVDPVATAPVTLDAGAPLAPADAVDADQPAAPRARVSALADVAVSNEDDPPALPSTVDAPESPPIAAKSPAWCIPEARDRSMEDMCFPTRKACSQAARKARGLDCQRADLFACVGLRLRGDRATTLLCFATIERCLELRGEAVPDGDVAELGDCARFRYDREAK